MENEFKLELKNPEIFELDGFKTDAKYFFEEQIIPHFFDIDGSDIHMSPNNFVAFRSKGILLQQHRWEKFTAEHTKALFLQLISYLPESLKEYTLHHFQEKQHCGFSITAYSDGNPFRYRVNVAANNSGFYIVLRGINSSPPDLEKLGFNQNTMNGLRYVATRHAGLFLVVGATGSGKSTTLASLIKLINKEYHKNIITLEDPIEYEHESMSCQIIQKELGRDFSMFIEGLHSALREDPDVILIGEIRDEKSLDLCLKAAETGHLVFATLHTQDAIATIQRLSAMSSNPVLVRDRLSNVMLGAIAQKLALSNEGKRICVWEILVNDKASAALIREEKDTQLKGILDTKDMCQSFNKTLKDYYKAGIISEETAFAYSPDPKYLNLNDVDVISSEKKQFQV